MIATRFCNFIGICTLHWTPDKVNYLSYQHHLPTFWPYWRKSNLDSLLCDVCKFSSCWSGWRCWPPPFIGLANVYILRRPASHLPAAHHTASQQWVFMMAPTRRSSSWQPWDAADRGVSPMRDGGVARPDAGHEQLLWKIRN